ncbi:tRNA (cytidine/uridine-2'-O-)-methyltransferase TrmJ [Sphingomonas antarctica]|uniref:TrmH family RNA methyltransferase n=1 Tax=Sphingomonas antarctica TaxID=2040274 RepID=UPI0039E76160
MSFWTYILRCSDGRFYVGHTDDLEKRVAEHQSGVFEGFTHSRRPVELVWSEYFQTRYEALEIERKLKGWSRAKKQALIDGDWKAVSTLAARPTPVLRDAASTSSAAPQDKRIFSNSVRPEDGLSEGAAAAQGPSRRTPPPIIVLVRPQLAENIGKAARAMLNFGLTELRLVSPRDGWPNPDAGPAAAGADALIANAQVYDSVSAAVADCAHVYATTVRKRGVTKPVVDAAEAASEIRAATTRSAILFGPERAGLETDDVAIARAILTIPVNPAFSSLNLAQAVILVAYEWSRGETLAQPTKVDDEPPASQFDLDGMIEQFDSLIDAAGFYFPPPKVPSMRRNVRSILTKPGWTTPEIRTIRGILSALQFPRSSKRSNS